MAITAQDFLPEDQIPPGSRNVLYRKRRVRLECFWSKSGQKSGFLGIRPETVGDGTRPDVIDLAEVSSISIQTQSGTGIGLGPVRATIQPWYFQPVKIEVQGKSYIGAFATRRLNIGVDTDVRKLLQFRNNVNQDFRNGDIRNLKVALVHFDSNDASNLAVSQEYEGFIDDLSFSENQNTPYMVDYVIRYVGEFKDTQDILGGANAHRDDRSLINKAVAGIQASVSNVPVLNRLK